MSPSYFKAILENLKPEVFEKCYFAVIFEEQVTILDCKARVINFKAKDKDDLSIQIYNYRTEHGTAHTAITDIAICSYFD